MPTPGPSREPDPVTRTVTIYLVIFGAAVRPDGSPSPTLRRRCEQAVALGRAYAAPIFLTSGGVGRHGPAEALVMRDVLLAQGVPAARILVEPLARDTLESVRLCTRLLRARGDAQQVLACSSSYHNPRCALLFRIAGFASRTVDVPSDRRHLGVAKWLRYVLKECLAIPWDATLLLAYKIRDTI